MKILIYGFKPYNRYQTNISEQVIKGVRNKKNLRKVIFPVEFSKRNFISQIGKIRPDIIIGLGQTSKGRKLKIERRAVNLKRGIDGKKSSAAILEKRARYLFVSLKLKKNSHSRISYNAGKYVCNYSMYVILDFLRKYRKSIKFAFIHIPKNYHKRVAVRYLEKTIQSIKN